MRSTSGAKASFSIVSPCCTLGRASASPLSSLPGCVAGRQRAVDHFGWASIALVALIAVAIILAARGAVPPALFGGLTLAALAGSALLLAATAFTLLRVTQASRR